MWQLEQPASEGSRLVVRYRIPTNTTKVTIKVYLFVLAGSPSRNTLYDMKTTVNKELKGVLNEK